MSEVETATVVWHEPALFWLTGAVEEWCAGTIVLDDEVRRIARALTHPRMMPIPGVTR